MKPFPGFQIYPLSNPSSQCAAYSQTWLACSLLAGAPVMNLTLLSNGVIMSSIQRTAGGPTAQSLSANGMQINGAPIQMNNATWVSVMLRLYYLRTGYYYMTSKNPHHAMACHMAGRELLYLEPEEGLYRVRDRSAFCTAAAWWYEDRTGSKTNTEFKIYAVTPGGAAGRSTTRSRRMIGTHR